MSHVCRHVGIEPKRTSDVVFSLQLGSAVVYSGVLQYMNNAENQQKHTASNIMEQALHAYLDPLLQKHAAGQLVVYEDLLSSWDSSQATFQRGDVDTAVRLACLAINDKIALNLIIGHLHRTITIISTSNHSLFSSFLTFDSGVSRSCTTHRSRHTQVLPKKPCRIWQRLSHCLLSNRASMNQRMWSECGDHYRFQIGKSIDSLCALLSKSEHPNIINNKPPHPAT